MRRCFACLKESDVGDDGASVEVANGAKAGCGDLVEGYLLSLGGRSAGTLDTYGLTRRKAIACAANGPRILYAYPR